MQEIESNKKERLNETNKKKKQRRCTNFCQAFSTLNNPLQNQMSLKGNIKKGSRNSSNG